MKKSAPFFSTTLWVFVGRAGGLLVPLLIALQMGAGSATDAFFIAFALIMSLLNVIAHVFESSVVPYLVEYKERPQQAVGFIQKALRAGLPLSVLAALGFPFMAVFLLRLSPSVESGMTDLVIRLYFEMLPGLVIAILISAYQGFFYAWKKFWFPSVSPIFRTLTMAVFFLLWRRQLGIHSLTYGFAAGEMLRWAAAHVCLTRYKVDVTLKGSGETKKMTEFFSEASYQVMVLVALNLLPLADQWAAATLGPGSVSLFSYADRLLQIPYLLFFYGFTQVFFSFWSESRLIDHPNLFFQKVGKDMRIVFWGALALVALMWLASDVFIQVLFQRAHLSKDQMNQLADIFRWLALGFLPGIFRILYGRILIVLKESKFYFYQSWVELLAKVALNFLFVAWFGLKGLAIAVVVIYSVTALWLYFYIAAKRQMVKLENKAGEP